MWKIPVDLMRLAKKSCEVGDAVKLMKWSKHAKAIKSRQPGTFCIHSDSWQRHLSQPHLVSIIDSTSYHGTISEWEELQS